MNEMRRAAASPTPGVKALSLVGLALLVATCPAFAGQTTFQYDNLDRLQRVTFADGSYTAYTYDADGNRKSQSTVARPTLLVQRTPSPMVAGEPFSVRWFTTGATSIRYDCTAPGTGYNGGATHTTAKFLPDGYASAPSALQAWVGFDSNCLWTASGPGGVLPITEVLRTVAAVPGRPTLTVTRLPSPMVAGRPYRVDWVATGAAALSFNCTAAGTGYNGQGALTVFTGFSASPQADPGWVGFPSACRWTATAANGAVTIHDESLVTIPDAQTQTQAQVQMQVEGQVQGPAQAQAPAPAPAPAPVAVR